MLALALAGVIQTCRPLPSLSLRIVALGFAARIFASPAPCAAFPGDVGRFSAVRWYRPTKSTNISRGYYRTRQNAAGRQGEPEQGKLGLIWVGGEWL
jgi:hypothetical protein